MDKYERLMTGQDKQSEWKELARQAREQIRAELDERQLPSLEKVLQQTRDERDAQLLSLYRCQAGHAPGSGPDR